MRHKRSDAGHKAVPMPETRFFCPIPNFNIIVLLPQLFAHIFLELKHYLLRVNICKAKVCSSRSKNPSLQINRVASSRLRELLLTHRDEERRMICYLNNWKAPRRLEEFFQ
jgi:hypothetical protein